MITTAYVTTALQYDPTQQRQYLGVYTLPHGQVIPNVEFPQSPFIDVPPVGSIVLIIIHGSFNAAYICKLVDPSNGLSRTNLQATPNTTTGSSPVGGPFIEPGEAQIAVNSGANIFLTKMGGIHLTAGTVKDEITIDSDEINVKAGRVNLYSTSATTATRPVISVDSQSILPGFDSAILGIENPVSSIQNPLGRLLLHGITVDVLGNITIQNLAGAGGSIKITPVGNITITSSTQVSVIAPAASVTSASVSVRATDVSIDTVSASVLATDVSVDATDVSVTAASVGVTADEVSVTSPDIVLGGPAGQALATEAFVKAVFDTHIHNVFVLGPSTPPIPTSSAAPSVTTTTRAL